MKYMNGSSDVVEVNVIPHDAVPRSEDAERAVIGSVLIAPEIFDDIAPWLAPRDFFIVRHEFIWDALSRLSKRKDTIDVITLTNELKAMGRLQDVGGDSYVTELMLSTTTSMHGEAYGRLVYRAALRRRLIECGDKLRTLALKQDEAIEDVMADAEREFTSVRDTSLEDGSPTFTDMVGQFVESVLDRIEYPDRTVGIPSGWHDLDELLGGWHKGDLIILAGRPGMGKTGAMLTAALNAAKFGARVGIASQEMTYEQVIARFCAIETGIDLPKLNRGRLNHDEARRFLMAAGTLAKLPIHVVDASELTPARLRMQALRWMRRGGLDLLMVDYLQIMSSEKGMFKGDRRAAEVGYFARSLKALAKELRIPVLVAAQLSREVEKREDKRPVLSDLRESGEIEQEADIVAFLYRDVVYNEATEFPNRADVIVAKHRNGPPGVVSLYFEKVTTRFRDARTTIVDLSALGVGAS